jgi:hypothetical protein
MRFRNITGIDEKRDSLTSCFPLTFVHGLTCFIEPHSMIRCATFVYPSVAGCQPAQATAGSAVQNHAGAVDQAARGTRTRRISRIPTLMPRGMIDPAIVPSARVPRLTVSINSFPALASSAATCWGPGSRSGLWRPVPSRRRSLPSQNLLARNGRREMGPSSGGRWQNAQPPRRAPILTSSQQARPANVAQTLTVITTFTNVP